MNQKVCAVRVKLQFWFEQELESNELDLGSVAAQWRISCFPDVSCWNFAWYAFGLFK